MDVDQLMAMASHAQDTGHVDAACDFYEIALQKMPHHADVLEAYAEVLLHYKNQSDRARQMLRHAIEVCPDEGYIKFLNLAQMSGGFEALRLYEAAVQIIKQEMSRARRPQRKRFLGREASTATVAAAELFLTDLCDEQGAEQRCELLIQEALGYWPTNMEAMQAMGSLRLSQQRPDEARGALLEAIRLHKAAPESQQPSFDSKIELSRLVMQVDLSAAFNFLLLVLNMDDTSALTWFLLAECARMRGRFVDAARLFRRSRIVASHCNQEHALEEIDNGIRALVVDMGGNADVLSNIPDMDHADPISLLTQEEGDDEDDDVDEPDAFPEESDDEKNNNE